MIPGEDRVIDIAGKCPYVTCPIPGPHKHFVCGHCGSVRFSNIYCGHCSANRRKEMQLMQAQMLNRAEREGIQ